MIGLNTVCQAVVDVGRRVESDPSNHLFSTFLEAIIWREAKPWEVS